MIDAYMTNDAGEVRTYVLAEPVTTARIDHLGQDGSPVFSEETVAITDVTVTIPQQWEHSITIPAVLVTGSGPGVNENVGAYAAAVPWEQVLDDLGLQLAPGEPPPPPQPHLVGAVPTAADLPAAPEPFGVYLARDTEVAHCRPDGEEWLSMPWSPGCESLFGVTADEVPDVGGTP